MTQEQNRPSEATWRRLYEAAMAFKEAACWNWMYDEDLFGVKDPVTGEIGYCCVMGAGGEIFGLAVYLGSKGLDVYLKELSRKTRPDDIELLFAQRCLTAFFCYRYELNSRDLRVIRSLSLRFRGANAWPQFRSYRPGYFPWHLDEGEASYLAIVLEQALNVADRFRVNRELLGSAASGLYLVRTANQEEGEWTWKDEWLRPEPLPEEKLSFEPVDEAKLARIKEKVSPSEEVWEGDFFHLEKAVAEGGRPFFPRMFVWTDVGSGLILGQHVNTPDEPITPLRGCLIEAIENTDILPREIRVRKKEAVELLAPVADSLQIKLVKAASLPTINRFRREIRDYLESDR